MQNFHAYNNTDNPQTGFLQYWFAGDPGEVKRIYGGISNDDILLGVDEKILEQAYSNIKFSGIHLPEPAIWNPCLAPYNNKAFLHNGIYIVHSTMKKPQKGLTVDLPQRVLALVANEKDNLIKEAKFLKLPINELVESIID